MGQDREQQLDDFTQAVRPDAALSREVGLTIHVYTIKIDGQTMVLIAETIHLAP